MVLGTPIYGKSSSLSHGKFPYQSECCRHSFATFFCIVDALDSRRAMSDTWRFMMFLWDTCRFMLLIPAGRCWIRGDLSENAGAVLDGYEQSGCS